MSTEQATGTETVPQATGTESTRDRKARIKAEREDACALVIDRLERPETKTAIRTLFEKHNPNPAIFNEEVRAFLSSMPRLPRGALTQDQVLGEVRMLQKALDGLTVLQKALNGNNAAFRFLTEDGRPVKKSVKKSYGPPIETEIARDSWYHLEDAVERFLEDHAHSCTVLKDRVARAALELEKPRKELKERTKRVLRSGRPSDEIADYYAKRARKFFRILTGHNPYETVHDTKYDFKGFFDEICSILGIDASARRAFRTKKQKKTTQGITAP